MRLMRTRSTATIAILLVVNLLACHGYTLRSSRRISRKWKSTLEFTPSRLTPPSCAELNSNPKQYSRHMSTSTLTMHMGHSHSHHHHSHSHSNQVKKTRKVPKGWRGKLLLLCGRPYVRILFAAVCTLLPPILKGRTFAIHNAISRTDVVAFLLTSGVLSISDSIRDEIKAVLSKGESWRLVWLKHSTPLSADYFFRNDNAADRVTFMGVIINILLSSGKFCVGVACHSSALIADAGHSLSDLFSDFVTLWAVQVARLPPDDDHPYGHGKFESVGSLFLSLTLLGTGLSVGLSSYMKFLRIISAQRTLGVAVAANLVEIPRWPALVMAGLSIVSKEWLYRITKRVGDMLNSQVIIANAWHHRSDAYSSVLALISIGLAMSVPSFLAADPLAGMLVAGMIAMTGAEILGESMKQLTDAVIDEEMVKSIDATALEDADVHNVARVRARQVGSSALVDVEVEVSAELSASAMRAIEERIRVRIKSEVEGNILGVDVKAVAEDVVFYPLLTATAIEDSNVDSHTSATEIEEIARGVLESHADVLSVNGVTVHYVHTALVRVDANICIDPHASVSHANTLASTLRERLKASDDSIVQGKIFLDLNAEEQLPSGKVLLP